MVLLKEVVKKKVSLKKFVLTRKIFLKVVKGKKILAKIDDDDDDEIDGKVFFSK